MCKMKFEQLKARRKISTFKKLFLRRLKRQLLFDEIKGTNEGRKDGVIQF